MLECFPWNEAHDPLDSELAYRIDVDGRWRAAQPGQTAHEQSSSPIRGRDRHDEERRLSLAKHDMLGKIGLTSAASRETSQPRPGFRDFAQLLARLLVRCVAVLVGFHATKLQNLDNRNPSSELARCGAVWAKVR